MKMPNYLKMLICLKNAVAKRTDAVAYGVGACHIYTTHIGFGDWVRFEVPQKDVDSLKFGEEVPAHRLIPYFTQAFNEYE